MNDAQFPWLILVPQRNDITELYQLNEDDLLKVQQESLLTSKLLMQHYQGDKLNTAALGNMVPQLHLHHIVRFKHDAAWPKPVWGNVKPIPYEPQELKTTIAALQNLYQNGCDSFTPY